MVYLLGLTFPFRGNIPTGNDILLEEDIVKLKRCIYAAQVRLSFDHFLTTNLNHFFA